MEYIAPSIAALVMLLLLATGWIMTVMCLPGTWMLVVAAAGYAYLIPDDWRVDIGWGVVLGTLLLAIVGEVIESAAVAVGAKRAGGSKRAALLALVGSIGGAFIGGILGTPIPIVGSMVAIVLGASFGATAGAMLGEHWKGHSADQGWEVGKAAFWSRLVGTFGKIMVASTIVALLLIALLF